MIEERSGGGSAGMRKPMVSMMADDLHRPDGKQRAGWLETGINAYLVCIPCEKKQERSGFLRVYKTQKDADKFV